MALRRSLLCARTRSFALRMQTLVNSDTYDTDLKLVLHTTGLEHTGLLNNKPKKKKKKTWAIIALRKARDHLCL